MYTEKRPYVGNTWGNEYEKGVDGKKKIFSNKLRLTVDQVNKITCKSCNIQIMTVGNIKTFVCPKCRAIIKEE